MYEKEQLAAFIKIAGLVMIIYCLLMLLPYAYYTVSRISESSQPKPLAASTVHSNGYNTYDIPAPGPASIENPAGHAPGFYATPLFLKYFVLLAVGCFLFRRGEKLVIYLYDGIMLDNVAAQRYFDMLLKIMGLLLAVYGLSGIAGLLQIVIWGKDLSLILYAAPGLLAVSFGLYLMKSAKIVKHLAGFK